MGSQHPLSRRHRGRLDATFWNPEDQDSSVGPRPALRADVLTPADRVYPVWSVGLFKCWVYGRSPASVCPPSWVVRIDVVAQHPSGQGATRTFARFAGIFGHRADPADVTGHMPLIWLCAVCASGPCGNDTQLCQCPWRLSSGNSMAGATSCPEAALRSWDRRRLASAILADRRARL